MYSTTIPQTFSRQTPLRFISTNFYVYADRVCHHRCAGVWRINGFLTASRENENLVCFGCLHRVPPIPRRYMGHVKKPRTAISITSTRFCRWNFHRTEVSRTANIYSVIEWRYSGPTRYIASALSARGGARVLINARTFHRVRVEL